MFVEQILSAKGDQVVSAEPDASIAEIARLLKYHRIGAVVVTDAGGDLRGIITERDLAHGLADHGAKVLDMRVDQLMTAQPVTCTPEESINDVMRKMTESRFRQLPVVQAGRLVGIISIGDVVKSRLQELKVETTELRNYIVGTGIDEKTPN